MQANKQSRQAETYNDGCINVLKALDGVITETIKENIHFGYKTIGVNRFFNAKVAGSTIEKMISIPFNDFVHRDNLIELTEFRTGNKTVYEIVMLQEKYDAFPASIYLTLKRTDIEYVDSR